MNRARTTRAHSAFRAGALAAAVVLLGACATVGVDTARIRPPAGDRFDQALLAFAGGRLDEADGLLARTLDANPADLRAHDLRRAIARERGDPAALDVHAAPTAPPAPAGLGQRVTGASPALRAAVFKVIEARARLREANVSVGPELAVTTRFYPLGILARMTQSLYGGWWERRARMHRAEAEILEALAEYGIARETVAGDAYTAAVDGLEAQAMLGALAAERAGLEQQHRLVNRLVARGHRVAAEEIRIREQLGEVAHAEQAARQQLAVATARLNGLMDAPLDAPVDFDAGALLWAGPASVEAALEQALRNRYEMQRADGAVDAARARRDLYASTFADVDLFASYGGSEERTESAFRKGFSLGAVTRVPLLVASLRAARHEADSALIRQLELREHEVRNEIGIEVVDAFHEWHKRRADYLRQEVAVAAAGEERRIANARQVMDVSDDPLAALRADLELVRARRALRALEFATQRSLVRLASAMGVTRGAAGGTHGRRIATGGAGGGAAGARALWVWRTPFLGDAAASAGFLQQLAEERIATLFMRVTPELLEARRAAVEAFLAAAATRGVTVQALGGEPDWIVARRHPAAVRFARAVAAYNAVVPPRARFSALHLDVEPHALGRWARAPDRAQLLFDYIVLLDAVREVGAGLPLVVDLPVWFAGFRIEGIPFVRAVSARVDGVAIMAYARDAPRIRRDVQAFSDRFGERHPRLWIGVSAEREHLCAPALAQTLERMLAEVEHDHLQASAFSGVAIHDYDRLRALGSASAAEPAGRACEAFRAGLAGGTPATAGQPEI